MERAQQCCRDASGTGLSERQNPSKNPKCRKHADLGVVLQKLSIAEHTGWCQPESGISRSPKPRLRPQLLAPFSSLLVVETLCWRMPCHNKGSQAQQDRQMSNLPSP